MIAGHRLVRRHKQTQTQKTQTHMAETHRTQTQTTQIGQKTKPTIKARVEQRH